MPGVRAKGKSKPDKSTPITARCGFRGTGEVPTLAETGAFLWLPEAEIVKSVTTQDLPGRRMGGDWRFLKSAVRDWLRSPPPQPSTQAVLARIGSWNDYPYVEEELIAIYRQRGRAMAEAGE